MLCSCCVRSSMPAGAMISTPIGSARTSISISRSSSCPSRSILRNFCRVSASRGAGSGVADEAHRFRPRQQHVQHALLGCVHRAMAHLRHLLLARHLHCDVHQVLDDRIDLATDVADLGELRRFDLDERRAREPREATRDLGLADAGRTDHEDVLRRDLGAQALGHLHAAPAIAQGDRDGALGRALPDDVLVELLDDFSGGHGHGRG